MTERLIEGNLQNFGVGKSISRMRKLWYIVTSKIARLRVRFSQRKTVRHICITVWRIIEGMCGYEVHKRIARQD